MSNIRANTISDAAGTGPITLTGQSAAKAWINFNQSSTMVVNSSFNISSSVDQQLGVSYHSLTNSYSSIHFTATGNSSANSYIYNGYYESISWPKDAGSFFVFGMWQGTAYDLLFVSSNTFGDLA